MSFKRALIPAIVFAITLVDIAGASSRCDELRNSVQPEPVWFAQECVVNPNPLQQTAAPARAGTGLAYAHDVSPVSDNFVNHALSDFPGQAVVADSSLPIIGYDFDPTATTLYALRIDTNQLGTVNLGSGTFNVIGAATPLAGHGWTGLSIHPVNGTVFAVSSDLDVSSLYTLNPATGAAALIGTDSSIEGIVDIAVNCEGEIYGHDVVTDSIFKINPSTGQGTLVGPTGIDSNFAQGMDFDNESGVLYAWTYQGIGQNQYGTINLVTGDLMPLSIDNPLGEFEGATQTTCEGVQGALIFADGFESGNTSRWSAASP